MAGISQSEMRQYSGVWSVLTLNETTKTSHIKCGDTRNRLYFTAKNGVVLGYCHNCSKSGCVKHTRFAPTTVSPTTALFTPSRKWEEFANFETPDFYDTTWAPIDVQRAADVLYDPMSCRFITPIREYLNLTDLSPTAPVIGYNSRAGLKGQFPRYSLQVGDGFPGYMYYHNTTTLRTKDNPLVLVEDQMSACAVALWYPRASAVCLFGSNNNIEKAHRILKAEPPGSPIVVWLDNDNETVMESARITGEYLKLLGNHPVHVITAWKEPKKCTKTTVTEVLDRC